MTNPMIERLEAILEAKTASALTGLADLDSDIFHAFLAAEAQAQARIGEAVAAVQERLEDRLAGFEARVLDLAADALGDAVLAIGRRLDLESHNGKPGAAEEISPEQEQIDNILAHARECREAASAEIAEEQAEADAHEQQVDDEANNYVSAPEDVHQPLAEDVWHEPIVPVEEPTYEEYQDEVNAAKESTEVADSHRETTVPTEEPMEEPAAAEPVYQATAAQVTTAKRPGGLRLEPVDSGLLAALADVEANPEVRGPDDDDDEDEDDSDVDDDEAAAIPIVGLNANLHEKRGQGRQTRYVEVFDPIEGETYYVRVPGLGRRWQPVIYGG